MEMKIKEHDLVVVEDDDGSKVGTVVHIYNADNFVVEFMKRDKSSYVETVAKDKIKRVLK